jgi:hypothetical protein
VPVHPRPPLLKWLKLTQEMFKFGLRYPHLVLLGWDIYNIRVIHNPYWRVLGPSFGQTGEQIRRSQDGNSVGGEKNGNKLVLSPNFILRGVCFYPPVLDLPSLRLDCCSYYSLKIKPCRNKKILQIFWTDTQSHDMVPNFAHFILHRCSNWGWNKI